MQPTNPNQFTEKAWAAIANSQNIVKQARQQHMESIHLMQSLLEEEGLASQIFNKAGANVQEVRDRTASVISGQAKLAQPSESIYCGKSLDQLLDQAEALRKDFNDDYISVEHLVLAFARDAQFGKPLLRGLDLDEAKLKTVIQDIRGNQRVTDQTPEVKYESLEKYGRDLTELARSGKLESSNWAG